VDCDLHDAFTDETMATRLRVLNRWALQSDDVRLSMWDFLQSVAGGMARFVDGSERCDVHRTWRRRVLTRDRLWIHRAGRRTLRAFPL